jgi:mRNA-degrading endonuclease RelE of RelBE toxin-antitoxin system
LDRAHLGDLGIGFMDFRISDTFTDSLARLTGDEQKAVKTTAFDLQIDPANPGMRFHKLDKAKDKSFWSVRVNADIRLIVHRTAGSLLLCYVDHHDKAYSWAERRKLETHPKTGAAQLVEVRETVKEVVVPVYVQKELAPQPNIGVSTMPIFSGISDEELLGYGVPPEWISDVKKAGDADLYALADHLPDEAAEALLELATGGKPRKQQQTAPPKNPFDHPDAQRRFRVMSSVEELRRALDFPWEKWTVFLHPEQRQLVERKYAGPARVAGSAGTGKTIVALHRAVHLAKAHTDARVLLTTVSDTLARALHGRLKRLLGDEPRLGERIDVHSLDGIALRLYKANVGQANIASGDVIRASLKKAAGTATNQKFSGHFLWTEWDQVVDAWQLDGWEAYRDVARLGRKTRLSEAQRKTLWSIFEATRTDLKAQKLLTRAEMFTALAGVLAKSKRPPFDLVVVDEAQDVGIAQLRFLASLGGTRPDALFFAGDLGQRIFQQPFSWKALGVDVRGRSRTLKVNYRTSHQIRTQADKLLGPDVTDVDGIKEDRTGTVSVFNGMPPMIRSLESEAKEAQAVAEWMTERKKEGVLPHEFAVFVRSDQQLERAKDAAARASMPFKVLDENVEATTGHVSLSTMHLAKGLEFRAVVVMACDDEVIPLQSRIETVGDDGDLKEVYDTERQLLYVACTRARDFLLVTSVEPASEFLDDIAER